MAVASVPRSQAAVRGAAAFGALALLVAGVPAVLWAVSGSPLPDAWPSAHDVWAAVAMPDDGTLFLAVLIAVGWAGWLTFVLSLLVELVAAVRGTTAPRLPGLGAQQRWVAGMVAAVAALGGGAQAAHAGSATAPPWEPAPPVTTDLFDQHVPADDGGAVPGGAPGDPDAAPNVRVHVVRQGDTLWRVADTRLGDAHRYPEIVRATADVVQPDGRRLTDPDLILPGWTLTIPPVEGSGGGGGLPDTGSAPTEPASLRQDSTGPASTGPATTTSGTAPPADAGPAAPACRASTGLEPADPETDQVHDGLVRTVGGVGAVLAAGLTGVLTVRRARRQRRRRPGDRLVAASPADRAAETELRQAADPDAVAFVDLTLRGLAESLARTGRGLPLVRAARLTRRDLELYLAAPGDLPAPFVGTAHGGVWTASRASPGAPADHQPGDGPAPYPSLVSVGHDGDDGLVLLDLEQLGSLVVDGPPDLVHSAITAMAAELATSRWADDLRISVVGGGAWADLGLLQTGRVRMVTDVEALLAELTVRAADDRLLLAAAGVHGLGGARAARLAEAAWTPEILVIAEPLPEDQWRRLETLIETAPRVAVAAVIGGHGAASGWALRMRGTVSDPVAVLEPLGVPLRPQLLDDATRARVRELVRAADSTASELPEARGSTQPARPAGQPPDATEGPPSSDSTRAESRRALPGSAPRLLMLGRVGVEHTAELVEPTKLGQLTELAMFIALNPGCDTNAIDEAIWPGSGVTRTTRGTAISKLRRWLGTDATGASLLPRTEGGYTFLPDVRSDWQEWCELLSEGPARATTTELRAALALVRGRPFSGRGRRRYAWVDHIAQEMISSIVDACHELAMRALVDGDPSEALRVALLGLSVEPGVELLWRDRLKAELSIGDRSTVLESISRLRSTADDLGGDLEPETEELIERITSRGGGLTATR
ncbi:BTAD domain-containing putative transcriptional regulator [Jiangella gansuensis]|uniref:BTAD domain-containing putative transcriptional regulator n=1 Tax=Jiangella gansuensis TaxID=281473 RepID=UPI00047CC3D7|nr:BTAD domain-containing putative transcriptional regulator [Jiangella gansuensis]